METVERTTGRRLGVLPALTVCILLVAVAALGWFTFMGTTTAVSGTLTPTCEGTGLVGPDDYRDWHRSFVAVEQTESETHGEIQTNHRLFHPDRYAFVGGGKHITLTVDPSPTGTHCAG